MNYLTEEQVNEFKGAFSIIDIENKNSVDRQTLRAAMRQLGLKPTDEELRDMIKEADTLGKGSVDFTSFCTMMGERLKKFDTEDDILNAFECFDTEGKGYMDTDDLKDVLSQDGPTKLLDREIRELVRMADENQTGQADYTLLAKACAEFAGSVTSEAQ